MMLIINLKKALFLVDNIARSSIIDSWLKFESNYKRLKAIRSLRGPFKDLKIKLKN